MERQYASSVFLNHLVSRAEIRREHFWHALSRTNSAQSESASLAVRKEILIEGDVKGNIFPRPDGRRRIRLGIQRPVVS